jgi:hypothetical protein
MTKIEKQMLEQINSSNSTLCATDWANGTWTGAYTEDKLMRRVYAILDLGERGLIVDHSGSWFHSFNTYCDHCDY